jgi:hypothetical protein
MTRVNRVVAGLALMAAGALLGGCSMQGGAGGKELVASGVPPISYMVGEPGTVYVRNVNTGALVHSGRYTHQRPFLVVVGGEVKLRDLSSNDFTLVDTVNETDCYEIWFRPAEKAKLAPTTQKSEETTQKSEEE